MVDPAPDDMPGGGAPSDYSAQPASDPAAAPDSEPALPDLPPIPAGEVLDKAPDDFDGGDAPPDAPPDYSAPDPERPTTRSSGQRIASLPLMPISWSMRAPAMASSAIRGMKSGDHPCMRCGRNNG